MELHFLKLTCSASVICSQVPRDTVFTITAKIEKKKKKNRRAGFLQFSEPGSIYLMPLNPD
jgi:hypothetical protein